MAWKFARTTVITGAGSGIGRALALELARDGFKVGVSDVNVDGANDTLAMVKQAGGAGEVYKCDVRDPDEFQRMADHFYNAWGEIGLLINNAGLMAAGYAEAIPLDEWRKVVDTDLWGPVHGCRAFLPRMKKQPSGHIMIVASMSGVTPPMEEAPYNVAKAGAIALGETLKTELAPFNIGVTVVNPMGVKTNVIKNSYTNPEIEELWDISFEKTKQTPEDVARRALRSVQKNKLYCYPHFHGKMFVLQKRLSPEMFFKNLAFMSRKGWLKPWLRTMAKRGWL